MRNVNIMPMAGKGKRFIDYDYKIQKPLIKINKAPMFVEASKSMPFSKKNIFIYRNHNANKINLKSFLPKNLKKYARIIYLKSNTKGQADTCLKAEKYIDINDSIFIHSCDCYIEYNKKKYLKLIKKNDVIVFSTKPKKYHFDNLDSFGWISGNKNKIKNIECKKKASEDYRNDYIIVGSFAFRNKFFFKKSIRSLMKKNIKINSEYYLDLAIKEALLNNFKVYNYVVDKHISWGTPKEINFNLKL